jgi:hypothetical protein
LNAFAWYEKVLAQPNSIKDNGYLLFELFCTTDSLTSRTDSGWPRPKGFEHLVLLGAGTYPSASKEEDMLAKKMVEEGMMAVFGVDKGIGVVPNAIEDFHDVPAVSSVLCVILEVEVRANTFCDVDIWRALGKTAGVETEV